MPETSESGYLQWMGGIMMGELRVYEWGKGMWRGVIVLWVYIFYRFDFWNHVMFPIPSEQVNKVMNKMNRDWKKKP